MNQLVFIQNNQVVTDSLTIAEVFDKRHADVLRDIDGQIEKLDQAGESEWGLRNFAHTQYQHQQNKQWYPKYDLTEDAFALVAMSYVTPEAMKMKVKFLEQFKQMKEQINNPLAGMSKELQAIVMIDKRTVEIENRLLNLEQTKTVDYSQQQVLNSLCKRKVMEIIGGKESPAYKQIVFKVFKAVWNDYQEYFAVNSYRNTATKDFEKAKEFLQRWTPRGKLLREIEEANGQMNMFGGFKGA
ncbi:Rha family transcriptional regulator [Brevibacillus laterosporus]|uniref:Rha family transcriptional regulator n=1 Tax=Brevibacillus laterosporus TaxID=1465 RepID=UPI0018CD1F53|nr:Rha family transcriptional regulator [Brevibacillus laterosporus]